MKAIVRTDILKKNRRWKRLSDVTNNVKLEFSKVHGSALFTRGETQAIMATTLALQMMSKIESLDGLQSVHLFSTFSVGETGRIELTKKLDMKTCLSNKSLATKTSIFRIVLEITESNGSSSMASLWYFIGINGCRCPLRSSSCNGIKCRWYEFSVLSDILVMKTQYMDFSCWN